jgi:hypothetical protein
MRKKEKEGSPLRQKKDERRKEEKLIFKICAERKRERNDKLGEQGEAARA